jgi:hypothetical protein
MRHLRPECKTATMLEPMLATRRSRHRLYSRHQTLLCPARHWLGANPQKIEQTDSPCPWARDITAAHRKATPWVTPPPPHNHTVCTTTRRARAASPSQQTAAPQRAASTEREQAPHTRQAATLRARHGSWPPSAQGHPRTKHTQRCCQPKGHGARIGLHVPACQQQHPTPAFYV